MSVSGGSLMLTLFIWLFSTDHKKSNRSAPFLGSPPSSSFPGSPSSSWEKYFHSPHGEVSGSHRSFFSKDFENGSMDKAGRRKLSKGFVRVSSLSWFGYRVSELVSALALSKFFHRRSKCLFPFLRPGCSRRFLVPHCVTDIDAFERGRPPAS